ncbi:MAG: caspase family protein [Myxococcota bacterium]
MLTLAFSLAALAGPDRAVVVGSNRAGPGQVPLQWAHRDAERVRDVLVEIGGFAPEDVEVLLDPGADAVLAAIDGAAASLDDTGRFFLYYSGHARARTLALGPDELSVDTIDDRLASMPARQRLAVLDACQSGEDAGAKGIVPEAAFSFVSVAGLTTSGTAVIASSTASELSQESPRLGASTFTHHWLSALRGAADRDGDGAVSLDEAYAYAYDRTVAETAATRIGTQHPTLRVDLRGYGDWILTRPTPATGALLLGATLQGAVTVTHRGSGSVLAEVAKVADDPVRLALAPGAYDLTITRRGATQTCGCEVRAGAVTALERDDCEAAAPSRAAGKGPPLQHPLALALRGGVAYYGPFFFRTLGAEVSLDVGRARVLAGGGLHVTRRTLPPDVALETGERYDDNWIFPWNVGAVYQHPWGPYLGADVVAMSYYHDAIGSDWAVGPRVRAGADVWLRQWIGLNVDLALGVLVGENWPLIEAGAPRVGPYPAVSLGVRLRP